MEAWHMYDICHAVLLWCALPCPALPCPALSCPALPCPALPCPSLPCPALLMLPQCQICSNTCLGIACSPACCGSIHCCSLCGKCLLTLLLCLQTKSLQIRRDSAQLQIPPPPNHSQAVTAQPMCMMASFVHHHSLPGQPSESLPTATAS